VRWCRRHRVHLRLRSRYFLREAKTLVNYRENSLEIAGSGVHFFKSEALARHYLALASIAHLGACPKSVVAHEPKNIRRVGSDVDESMFSDPQISTAGVSLPGVPTYGAQMRARSALSPLTGKGPLESYVAYLNIVVGDAVIALNATAEPHPFPTATERRLLALLYSRSRSRPL
jgi:hypothetical protein